MKILKLGFWGDNLSRIFLFLNFFEILSKYFEFFIQLV